MPAPSRMSFDRLLGKGDIVFSGTLKFFLRNKYSFERWTVDGDNLPESCAALAPVKIGSRSGARFLDRVACVAFGKVGVARPKYGIVKVPYGQVYHMGGIVSRGNSISSYAEMISRARWTALSGRGGTIRIHKVSDQGVGVGGVGEGDRHLDGACGRCRSPGFSRAP